MKKYLAIILSLAMVLSLAACGGNTPATEAPTQATTAAPTTAATTPAPTEAPTTTPEATTPEATTEPPVQAMTYAEYMAAEVDAEVTIQGTIQLAAYNKEHGNASLFLADKDGAYYVYRMSVDEKDADKMTEGTVLLVKGHKTIWSGEVEVQEGATYEILEDAEPYIAEAKDVTDVLGTDDLEKYMNQKVLIRTGLIAPSALEDESVSPFLYKWNGSGEKGDDVYFNVRLGHDIYTVLIESDEFGADSEVYKAAEELGIWAQVELEGFLYWYEGPQPHITSIQVMEEAPTPMTQEEFAAAEKDSTVVLDVYVQKAVYNEEEGYVNLFVDGPSGATYVYKMPATPEEAKQLTEAPGAHIWVKGIKTTWSGEVEIVDGSFEFFPGTNVSEPEDITAVLEDDDTLPGYMNKRIRIQGAVVAPSKADADEKEYPFLYKWNGSGEEGDDLYFTVTVNDQDYILCVESDECPADSDVYKAVTALKIGDTIDLEGFLYWYEGPQPHIYSVKAGQGPQGMSYLEFLKAEVDTEVTVDSYVQLAAYNAEKGAVSLFLADPNGGSYYVYQMEVSEEEAAKLVEGAHVVITGYKKTWSGEVEILDASFQLLEGEYKSQPIDLTAGLDQAELLTLVMNSRMAVHGAILAGSENGDGEKQPFLYKWNGTGVEGDDIYFDLLIGGKTFTFVVESEEFGSDSDLYKAIQALEIGDVLDVEGFLYWYEGPQPHVCAISTDAYAKISEEAIGFGRYMLAEVDTPVVVEGFVQLATSYWEKDGQGLVNLYLHDKAGAYYVYNLPVTEEEAASLEPGTLVRVSGTKVEWSELLEIGDATFEILDSKEKFVAEPVPALYLFQDDENTDGRYLIGQQMIAEGLVVTASQTEDGQDVPFLYKWNGSGEEGDDIYLQLSYMDKTITAVVESDEFGPDSEVYKAAQALEIGDVVDMTAFLYWYNGPQPHLSSLDTEPYEKTEGALRYPAYMAAEKDETVTIDAYVQQAAFYEKDGEMKANLFLDDRAGGYYVYGMTITEEDAAALYTGSRLVITGTKTEWSGEVEIIDVTEYTLVDQMILEGYQASPLNLANHLEDEEFLVSWMNRLFMLKEVEVIASEDADGKEAPFLYKWNGTGEEGDDIYFKVKAGETEMTIVVESDELLPESPEYQAVQKLQVGDKIDLSAFMYWYEGPQPHLYQITVHTAEE